MWTGKHREGGREHQVRAPIDHVPLHARAGSILPLGPVLQSTAEATGERIDIYIFPGRDGSFTLYEDDGLSNLYEHGAGSRIRFTWDDKSGELHIGARQGAYEGMPANRTFVLHRIHPGQPPLDAQDGRAVVYSGSALGVRLS
jgi:alpha-D-xyloside xylohydrolase